MESNQNSERDQSQRENDTRDLSNDNSNMTSRHPEDDRGEYGAPKQSEDERRDVQSQREGLRSDENWESTSENDTREASSGTDYENREGSNQRQHNEEGRNPSV